MYFIYKIPDATEAVQSHHRNLALLYPNTKYWGIMIDKCLHVLFCVVGCTDVASHFAFATLRLITICSIYSTPYRGCPLVEIFSFAGSENISTSFAELQVFAPHQDATKAVQSLVPTFVRYAHFSRAAGI